MAACNLALREWKILEYPKTWFKGRSAFMEIPELSFHHDYEARFSQIRPPGTSLSHSPRRQLAMKSGVVSESARPLMNIPLSSDESGSSQSDGEESLAKRLTEPSLTPTRPKYSDRRCTMTTLPRTSLSLAAYPDGWTECFIPPSMKKQILALPETYRIVDIPGRGRGMIAACALKMGDLILDERALLIEPEKSDPPFLPAGYPMHKLTPDVAKTLKYMHHEKMAKAALERMPQEYRKAFMGLYSCQSAAELNTNGFSIGSLVVDGQAVPSTVAGHEKFSAVWATISLFNHSCCQNVIGQWDTTSFSMQVRAARDIAIGEELTLQYNGNPLHSTAARHRELAHYKFQCVCPACQQPAESDARRSRVCKLFADCPASSISGEYLQQTLEALRLVELELLHASEAYLFFLHEAVKGYVALGDAITAQGYAKKLARMGERWEYFNRLVDMRTLKSLPYFGKAPQTSVELSLESMSLD
ncbi:SET domain-containing protein [Hymenopellis radicata]|nr:SET domain-containing protein [Hymenopellis radicata]